MDNNNVQNINDEIHQVLNNFRFYSNEENRQHNTTRIMTDSELLFMLYEIMREYNTIVRINNDNMTRYHENINIFNQIMNRYQQRQSRNQQYGYYRQNNNSIPNTRFNWTRTTRNHLDTLNTNIINEAINRIFPRTFQDVVVSPTSEQITRATETFTYHLIDDLHTQCPITLDEFQENENVCRIRHCGHTFRENAIRNWFQQNVRCPVCRYDIRTNNETDPAYESQAQEEELIQTPDEEQDISHNYVPPSPPRTPPLPRNTTVPLLPPRESINRAVRTISGGIQNILQNYLDGETFDESSLNRVFSFELPVYLYSDSSGNFV
jgi:hypothetical protein